MSLPEDRPMPSTRVTNPADWEKTLLGAVASLAIGLVCCGFMVYGAWADLRNTGTLTANTLTGLSCIGLGALMFLTFGVILLPIGLQERRQRRAIQSATTRDVAVVPQGERGWEPGVDVTGHGGRALTQDGDYFVAPPPEIGPIISAYTSLRKGVAARSLGTCLLAALAFGVAGFLLGWLVMSVVEPNDATAAPIVGGFLGLFGAVIGWALTRFKHACSYVGKAGVARFVCTGQRAHLTQREVFLFAEATDLRTSETERYENGTYRGTVFHFDWSDREGQVRFQITGMHRGSLAGRNPWLHMPCQWGRAAEDAWNLFRLEHLLVELEREGSIRLNLDRGDWLAVGPGFLDIGRGGETICCRAEDVEDLSLSAGLFTLRLRGGRTGFFGSSGLCKFAYGELANVGLFLHFFKQLLCIEVRSLCSS